MALLQICSSHRFFLHIFIYHIFYHIFSAKNAPQVNILKRIGEVEINKIKESVGQTLHISDNTRYINHAVYICNFVFFLISFSREGVSAREPRVPKDSKDPQETTRSKEPRKPREPSGCACANSTSKARPLPLVAPVLVCSDSPRMEAGRADS